MGQLPSTRDLTPNFRGTIGKHDRVREEHVLPDLFQEVQGYRALGRTAHGLP
jgi:hypothetical protein